MSEQIHLENLPDNIVLFDGECVLCSDFFKFLVKYDKRKVFRFATLQSDIGKLILRHAYKQEQIPDSVVLYKQGRAFDKSSAAIRILGQLGGVFSLVKILQIIPGFLLDWAYDLLAKMRYKLWGKQNCMIPDAEIRNRFVDDSLNFNQQKSEATK